MPTRVLCMKQVFLALMQKQITCCDHSSFVMVSSHRKPEAEISLTFVGRSLIRRLNSEHLGHDYVTDVISFSLSLSQKARPKKLREYPLSFDIS